MRLERQSIKELKREAVTLYLDTSNWIEKKDLVDLIMHKKKSSNLEKDGNYSESNNKESSPKKKKKEKKEKKKEQVDVMKVVGLIAT